MRNNFIDGNIFLFHMSNTNGNSNTHREDKDNIEDNFENLSALLNQDVANFQVLQARVRDVSRRINAAQDLSQEQLDAFRDLLNVITTHGFVFHIGQIIDEISKTVHETENKINFRVKKLGLH
jgi:predicted nucleic acid-binding protein